MPAVVVGGGRGAARQVGYNWGCAEPCGRCGYSAGPSPRLVPQAYLSAAQTMAMKRGEGQSPERREPTSKLFSPVRTLHNPAQRTTPEQAVAHSGVCNSMDDGTTPTQHAVDSTPLRTGGAYSGLSGSRCGIFPPQPGRRLRPCRPPARRKPQSRPGQCRQPYAALHPRQ